MLQRKYIAIVQTDDKTWDDVKQRSKTIHYSQPIVIKEDHRKKEYYDGYKIVTEYEPYFVYGLLICGYGKFNFGGMKIVDFIQTWGWDRNFLPLTFTRHYPFIQRKPF